MATRLDITWKKFNRLQVIACVWSRWKQKRSIWLCECDCWNKCEVAGYRINSGETKSCWCLMIERTKTANTVHWSSNTKLYDTFRSIKQRCTNENRMDYKNYGWRWIKNEWMSYEDFYRDMADTYKLWLSIDRINVNWNYCKENCRWATPIEQSNNKRNIVVLEYMWINHTISEWAEIRKMKRDIIRSRYYSGWTVWKTLSFN